MVKKLHVTPLFLDICQLERVKNGRLYSFL